LAIIVLIRTFLSFSLEVELSGRWPWQPARVADVPPRTETGVIGLRRRAAGRTRRLRKRTAPRGRL
jgi:hypothetical protein